MVHDANKAVAEADPEVSEAIDFARYYAWAFESISTSTWERVAARALGIVVVTPPWNFPYAIPAGGVLAALMAGNAVVLKPSSETERNSASAGRTIVVGRCAARRPAFFSGRRADDRAGAGDRPARQRRHPHWRLRNRADISRLAPVPPALRRNQRKKCHRRQRSRGSRPRGRRHRHLGVRSFRPKVFRGQSGHPRSRGLRRSGVSAPVARRRSEPASRSVPRSSQRGHAADPSTGRRVDAGAHDPRSRRAMVARAAGISTAIRASGHPESSSACAGDHGSTRPNVSARFSDSCVPAISPTPSACRMTSHSD